MKTGSGKSCPSCGDRYDAGVLFCPKDGTPLASARNPSLTSIPPSERDPYIGIELPGQIRIDTLIGIGSMGRVYRAFQGGIDRDVAVKVLHRELSGNAELTGRFHREAKVASRLVHPNVVQVLMTGAMPKGEDPRAGGELYLVMEFLDGISLLSALAAAGTNGETPALPLPRALHVALQICDAVGEAHAQGIVHRDLKPENVMLVRRGDDPDYVKVLDFGIARLEWADRGLATQAGLIFGSAKYISPEGAEGHPVTPAADVYSIATMLYQMLAGRTPFDGDSPVALLVQHTHAPPLDLRSIARASYVPAPLSAAIMANLAKKPGERAANARLFARELVAAARASGLYPEELASQFSPASFGAVKLASRERTRAHELSAEIAAKIGGVAARPTVVDPSAPEAQPVRSAARPELAGAALRTPAPVQASRHAASVASVASVATVTGATDEHEPVDPSELFEAAPAPAPRPSTTGVTVPRPRSSDAGLSGPPALPGAPRRSVASEPVLAPPYGATPRAPASPVSAVASTSHALRSASDRGSLNRVPVSQSHPPPSRSAEARPAGGTVPSGPTMVGEGAADGVNGTMPGAPLGLVEASPPAPSVRSGDGAVHATIQGEELPLLPPSLGDSAPGVASDAPSSSEAAGPPLASAASSLARRFSKPSKLTRRVAIAAACLFVLAPAMAFGGRRAGWFGPPATDSVEGMLLDARECMASKAWDAPPARNFRLVTDEAFTRFPENEAFRELRHQAAGLLVTQALERKADNDPVEASHLVGLALHFDPELKTAQYLSAELSATPPREPAPTPTASAATKPAKPKATAVAPSNPGSASNVGNGSAARGPVTSPATTPRAKATAAPTGNKDWL